MYFPKGEYVYDSVSFNELNKHKCLDIHYIIFRDKKVRFGIVLGETEEFLKLPFSAPFGCLSSNKIENLEYYDSAVSLLKEYSVKQKKTLYLTLPPTIYGSSVSKLYSSLMRCGAVNQYTDLNYQYELSRFPFFETYLDSNTRNKFRNAQKNSFNFHSLECENIKNIERVYNIIKKNREFRGFPLHMSLDAVVDTLKIVPADLFILTIGNEEIASALVYRLTRKIAQVIYWGDIPGYSNLRPMNWFSYKIFEFYFQKGLKILDIGPSTDCGIPNFGLCEFKENIGCSVSLKFTIRL